MFVHDEPHVHAPRPELLEQFDEGDRVRDEVGFAGDAGERDVAPAVEQRLVRLDRAHLGRHAWAYDTSPTVLAGAILFTLLLGIAVIDARHYIIPDALSLGGCAAGLALSALPGPVSPPAALLGALLALASSTSPAGWANEPSANPRSAAGI